MLKSEAAQEKGIAGNFTQTAATFLKDPTVWKLPAPAPPRAVSGAACPVWESSLCSPVLFPRGSRRGCM